MDKVIVIFLTDECHRKSSYFLEAIFTDAKPMTNRSVTHCVSEINGKLYDISGEIEKPLIDLYFPADERMIDEMSDWSFHENNVLRITDCDFCGEPMVITPDGDIRSIYVE